MNRWYARTSGDEQGLAMVSGLAILLVIVLMATLGLTVVGVKLVGFACFVVRWLTGGV